MFRTMKLWANLIAVACLLALACIATGQAPKPQRRDTAALRSRFEAAFGKDFDLVKDELKTRAVARGDGTYWLAFAKPKRTGYFYLQYRYHERFPVYSREHEIGLSVGPQGCRRGPPYAEVFSRFYLGDTVILPVLINDYTEFEFKLAKAEYTDPASPTFDQQYSDLQGPNLDQTEIPNPAAETLRYIGRSSYKAPHRSPGYTLNLGAVFEAVKPGRLNLLVNSSPAAKLETGSSTVHIIVVARDMPVTLLAGREEVSGFEAGNRARVVSTTSNNFITSVIILQPGDRISVNYFTVVRSGDFEGVYKLPDPR